jgi:hypothetical protein
VPLLNHQEVGNLRKDKNTRKGGKMAVIMEIFSDYV